MIQACKNVDKNLPEFWSEEELASWFQEYEWKHNFKAVPDSSINKKEFAISYHRNQERWKKAFTFLAQENLQNLKTGRYELDSTNLFVNIEVYNPKEVEEAQYEAHRKYADIQYVVSGKELISVIPIDQTVITTAYEEEKDIMFLAAAIENNRLATPEQFFIFFPNDAHRPSVKTEDSTLVKKIVVKVKLD